LEVVGSSLTLERLNRLESVDRYALQREAIESLYLEVGGVRIEVAFDSIWAAELSPLCRNYWQNFIVPQSNSELRITLSPARGEYVDRWNPFWNEADPFQKSHLDDRGEWIIHRDFTGLLTESRKVFHVWLPRPAEDFTDALDNLLSVSVGPLAEQKQCFLFHSTIVEHEGEAVVLFGPSGIGKSTAAKLSSELGYRVMASDQGYLRIEGDQLIASASPTRNPDVPRSEEKWATRPLKVKTLIALKRTGTFEIESIAKSEMARRFFAEVFRDESRLNFTNSLNFAGRVAALPTIKQASLSYPLGFNFWPRLKELGYT
jgi:hypothetical protein